MANECGLAHQFCASASNPEISPLIPMASHALPRMQWALVGAKRFECGSLLPLCSYAQTACLSPYPRGEGFCPGLPSSGLEPGTIGAPCHNGG